MSFPVYQSVGEYYSAGALTHPIVMPSGVTAGDLLVAITASDNVTNAGMADIGWCLWAVAQSNNTGDTIRVWTKIADGTAGATQNVVLPGTEALAAHVYRISGGDVTIAVSQNEATATGNTLVVTALSPSWGAEDMLWIEAAVAAGMTGISSMSSGYSAGIYDGSSVASGAALISAYRTANTGTESPGNITTTGSTGAIYATLLIAIRTPPSGGGGTTLIVIED